MSVRSSTGVLGKGTPRVPPPPALPPLPPADAGTSVLVWGFQLVGTSVAARFLAPGFEAGTAPLTVLQFRSPRSGVMRNLRVRARVAGVGAATLTYVVRINGVASALLVAMLATALDGSDLVDSVAVAAGDLVDIQVTKSAAITTSPTDVLASLEFGSS